MNIEKVIKQKEIIDIEKLLNIIEDKKIDSKCFGQEDGVCVRVYNNNGKIFYIADGFEWADITDKKEDVIEWFDNSINDDFEEIEKVEKDRKELIEFLDKAA